MAKKSNNDSYIIFRLPNEDENFLQKHAEWLGIKLSDLMRRIVTLYRVNYVNEKTV